MERWICYRQTIHNLVLNNSWNAHKKKSLNYSTHVMMNYIIYYFTKSLKFFLTRETIKIYCGVFDRLTGRARVGAVVYDHWGTRMTRGQRRLKTQCIRCRCKVTTEGRLPNTRDWKWCKRLWIMCRSGLMMHIAWHERYFTT